MDHPESAGTGDADRHREIARLDSRSAVAGVANMLAQRWAPLRLPARDKLEAMLFGMMSNAMDMAAVVATQREAAIEEWRRDAPVAKAALDEVVGALGRTLEHYGMTAWRVAVSETTKPGPEGKEGGE